MHNFRNILIIAILGVLLFQCQKEQETKEQKEAFQKPNVIFILADDLGWADLGAYGNTYFESPHLDKLAEGGMKFTNAYAACHVCSPTRASVMTGKYPARLKLTNFLVGKRTDENSPVDPADFAKFLPLEEETIGEAMKKQGYETGLVGKWHLGENTSLGKSDPEFQGFDYSPGFNYGLKKIEGEYKWFEIGDTTSPKELPYLTNFIKEKTIDFIRNNKEKPFFLMMNHYAVHLPLQAEAARIAKFEKKENPKPGEFSPVYAGMIEQMDETIGAVMAELRAQGLEENTLVVFTSDNGGLAISEAGDQPTTNFPLKAGKGTMNEGGIRVPAIFYWKGKITGGQVSDQVISTIDYLPTILDLVNGEDELEQELDGKSVLSSVMEGEVTDREPIFWHYPHFSNQGGRPKSAVLAGDFKLIESLENGAVELYNIKEDLSETDDLSEKLPEKVTELQKLLNDWRLEIDANMPEKK